MSHGRIMLLGPAAVGKTSLRHGLMNEPLPDKANSTVLAYTRPVKHYWVKTKIGRHSVCNWAEMSKEDEISENLQLFHQYRTSLTDVEKYDSVVDESRHKVVHSEVAAHEELITSRLISTEKIEDDEVYARTVELALSGSGSFMRPCLKLVFPTAAGPSNMIRPCDTLAFPLRNAWWYIL